MIRQNEKRQLDGNGDGETIERIVFQLKNLFCIVALDGTIHRINPSGCGMLVYSEDEIVGRPWSEIFEEHSRALASEIIKQTSESGSWGGEILFQRSDGGIFPVFLTTSLIPGISGGADFMVASATDITHRKQLEEMVRKRVELTSKIINNAPVGIVAFDRDGLIQIANRAFAEMLGLKDRKVLQEKNLDEINPELTSPLKGLLEKALEGESVSETNIHLLNDDERRLIVSLNLIPLEGFEGEISGALGLFEDRTDQAKMEERLIQADKLASLGFLAAGVAHEISNPLTGMYTIIEGFRDAARVRDEEDEPYERILSSIDRIKGIIGKLLAFANPSSQAPQLTQLNDLIINSMEFFKHQPAYRRIRIITELDEELPETVLDPNQITQVLHNLFINSAQAMEEGGEVRIKTSAHNNKINLVFEDTGHGIPGKFLPKIFDPFFTTKPAGTGTGLGLSVSYGIIQDHRGSIDVSSIEGGGTRFIITLPVTLQPVLFDE